MAKQNPAALVSLAEKYLGTPYKYGGASPTTGFDCSGFVQWLYAQQGINLPRVTYDQVNAGAPVDSQADLKAGDIVFFEPSKDGPGHEGLYIGDGKFIESPHTGANIRISDLAGRTDYVTARRVIPDGAPLIGNVAQAAATAIPDVTATPSDATLPTVDYSKPDPAATTDTTATAPAAPDTAQTQTLPLPTAPTPQPSSPMSPLTPPLPLPGTAQYQQPQAQTATTWQQMLAALPDPSPDTQYLLSTAGGSDAG